MMGTRPMRRFSWPDVSVINQEKLTKVMRCFRNLAKKTRAILHVLVDCWLVLNIDMYIIYIYGKHMHFCLTETVSFPIMPFPCLFPPNLETRECTILAHTLHQTAHMQQLRLAKMFDQRLGGFSMPFSGIENP